MSEDKIQKSESKVKALVAKFEEIPSSLIETGKEVIQKYPYLTAVVVALLAYNLIKKDD